jgi:hypothetical protein
MNPKEKEMFLVHAINNPQLKSLGKYEFKEPWHEGRDLEKLQAYIARVEAEAALIAAETEDLDSKSSSAAKASKGGEGGATTTPHDIVSTTIIDPFELTGRYHKGWEFNSETLILSLEHDQGEKSTYKLDIPSFENAQLIKITPENESLINKEFVSNIQRGSNFGQCKAIGFMNGGRVTGYEGLSLETNEFIQSKQVHVNCQAYVDGDYILIPKRSGEDAFYGGLDLYKKNGNHVQSIDFEEIPYVEVEKGQGIIFEADESGQNAKSAIYFCIEFTEHEYETDPEDEHGTVQKDAFESIFFWGLPDQCP